ncbi:MAG TPA: HD domain-containing protein [Anaerolineaceae bacterium]|jgi:metal-dependent HD superfamily phosphatase/phosphodiesterase
METRSSSKDTHANISIHVPLYGNELLEKALANINQDVELRTLWRIINVNAIDRLGMSDHGPVHFQIVANIALRLTRLLIKSNIEMSIGKYYGLSNNYAELVVLLASLFHDLGMTIHREGHEEFSLFLANQFLHKTLDFLPIEERTIVTSEVLHAIIAHRSGGTPLTIEAGIVRVADALDMSEGRSRIPYQAGFVDIYSLSAAAIDKVTISEGTDTPVMINITMNNAAGLFQVDELLKQKLRGSGIEVYVKVRAFVGEKEKRLLEEFELH